MVDRIGQGSSLAREAILAALRSQAGAADAVRSAADAVGRSEVAGSAAAPAGEPAFAEALRSGLREVDTSVRAAEALPEDLLGGKIQDFHEIAVKLKTADIGFRFALEVRNRLIDAYREVMRMTV
jgi:flagellar hook-basal body complex protein FliE